MRESQFSSRTHQQFFCKGKLLLLLVPDLCSLHPTKGKSAMYLFCVPVMLYIRLIRSQIVCSSVMYLFTGWMLLCSCCTCAQNHRMALMTVYLRNHRARNLRRKQQNQIVKSSGSLISSFRCCSSFYFYFLVIWQEPLGQIVSVSLYPVFLLEKVAMKDPPDLLDRQKCLDALASLRHAKWFQVGSLLLSYCYCSLVQVSFGTPAT